eukprot:12078488-Ditylum_brightwellii.AAC.2
MKSLICKADRKLTNTVAKLSLTDAKAFMMQGVFGKRTKKEKPDNSRKICIRLIFNANEEDRKEQRKTINEKLNETEAEILQVDR